MGWKMVTVSMIEMIKKFSMQFFPYYKYNKLFTVKTYDSSFLHALLQKLFNLVVYFGKLDFIVRLCIKEMFFSFKLD